jgi:hypothetical protein
MRPNSRSDPGQDPAGTHGAADPCGTGFGVWTLRPRSIRFNASAAACSRANHFRCDGSKSRPVRRRRSTTTKALRAWIPRAGCERLTCSSGCSAILARGFLKAVTRLTTESLIRPLENAYRALGGEPKVVVFDNASSGVKQTDWYVPELNPKIIVFCKHYGFTLVPTRPRTPEHKNQIE